MLYLVSDGKSRWYTNDKPQDGLTIISTEETLQQETYEAFLEEKTFVEGI